MFNWSWKTITTNQTTTKGGKKFTNFGDGFPKDAANSFKEAAKEFEEAAKEFADVGSKFEETESNFQVSTVEFYGTSKEAALKKANEWSKQGYKLISLDEDKKLEIWTAKMEKHEN